MYSGQIDLCNITIQNTCMEVAWGWVCGVGIDRICVCFCGDNAGCTRQNVMCTARKQLLIAKSKN